MPKNHQTIDLPKLPSFDVSNASSSVTNHFEYGDKSAAQFKPTRHERKDPFDLVFSRSDLQNVIHIITAELKITGSKTPFLFLPFRQEDDEFKLKQFLSRLFNGYQFIDEQLLTQVVKRTDEYTLISALKFFWCRLPNSSIVGWKSYKKFSKLEKEKGYPKKAFLSIMPYCLSSASHASIVYDFLDLLVSTASYSKDNKLSGRKICKMCGVWAFNGPMNKKGKSSKNPSFADGLNSWIPASDALFHIMLAFLRSMLPDDDKSPQSLPKSLQNMVSSHSYPPSQTKHSDPTHLLDVPIVTLFVNSPSKTPLELIAKIEKTLNFDNAKLFHSRDDYILLKSLFKDSNKLLNSLSLENKRIIDRICNLKEPDLVQEENHSFKYKLLPGWSDDLVTFDNQEPLPQATQFFSATVGKTLIDDYFIWTWLSTIGAEQANTKRKIFGKTFILEVELSENYKKWVIIEEQDIFSQDNVVSDNDDDSDMELELKLQKLRKQEAELLSKKLKKQAKLPSLPAKDKELPDPKSSKRNKMKMLNGSSKNISGKLASSIRKFSNPNNRAVQSAEKPLPLQKDSMYIPRDQSTQDFKLPAFDDDEDDLAEDFEEYLQQSTYSETKPLQIKQRSPSPSRTPVSNSRNLDDLTQMVDDLAIEQAQEPYESNGRRQMMSVYGLEQLQQYSPYINYEDGQFPSLSPQRSEFPPEVQGNSRVLESQSQQIQGHHYDDQFEPSLPSNQTSGSSQRRRKPPPPVSDDGHLAPVNPQQRPMSQHSGNGYLTPSGSQQQIRPMSQYSSISYANSFAPPTPQHQLLPQSDQEQSPVNSRHSGSPYRSPQHVSPVAQQQYQYRTMIPADSPTRTSPRQPQQQQQQQQQHQHQQWSPQSSPRHSGSPIRSSVQVQPLQSQAQQQPVTYQYRSMLSPVEPVFNPNDKSLPPSPVKQTAEVSAALSPDPRLSAPASPQRSQIDHATPYGSACSSPVRSTRSAAMSPGLREVSMDKPLPPSPVKSMHSAQQTPSPTRNSLYGDTPSPTRQSLYGDSKTNILETAKDGVRDSKYYSLSNEADAQPLEPPLGLSQPPIVAKSARSSAIIESFDALEGELQQFLNEDSKSLESQSSYKTGVDEPESNVTPPTSEEIAHSQMGQMPPSPLQKVPSEEDYYASPSRHVRHSNLALHPMSPAQSAPTQIQQGLSSPQQHGQQRQIAAQQASHRQMPQTMQVPGAQPFPAHVQPMPAAQKERRPSSHGQAPPPLQGYSQVPPNGSSHSLQSQSSSQGSDPSYGRVPGRAQDYNNSSPSSSNEYLQVPPQNGYKAAPAPQAAYGNRAHSPARPSNLGPNYQQMHPQQPQQNYQYNSAPPQQQRRSPQGRMGGAYPPQGGAYPPQAGAYPPQAGAYSPQAGAYSHGGQYPPQGAHYPPQSGQYPPQSGPPPQQYYAPVTPPSRQQPQYYQQSQLPPHPSQHGSRTPHHRPSGSFSPNPGYSPSSYKGSPNSMAQPHRSPYGAPINNNTPPAQMRSDIAIQSMPSGPKVDKLHGHAGDKSSKKNLRNAIANGGFGI